MERTIRKQEIVIKHIFCFSFFQETETIIIKHIYTICSKKKNME